MNIIFTYSAWWLLPGILLAAGLSLFLYYRDKKLKDIRKGLKYLLAVLRFFFVFALVFLLLEPEIQFFQTKKQKPVFLILQDNSSSVTMNADSLYYKNEYLQSLNDFRETLSGKFDVRTILFGDSVREQSIPDFSDCITDMSALADAVELRFNSDEVGGVLLASDGLYNKGFSPLSRLGNLPYPFYTLALGDTTQQRDVLISEVRYNKLAFLNNRFPVRVYYEAWDAKNETLHFKVEKQGKVLYSKKITVKESPQRAVLDFELDADVSGLQIYTLKFKALDGELVVQNNEQSIVVNVIDNQQEILLLAQAPHPDLAAIRRALETNLNFSVKLVMADQLMPKLDDADLVVLHDLPSSMYPMSAFFNDVRNRKIPTFFIFGKQTSFNSFNQLAYPLQVKLKNGSFDNAQPALSNDFGRFEMPVDLVNIQEFLPPLSVPFADFKISNVHEILLTQKISGVNTDKPLLAFTSNENVKSAFLCGSGIWQWRMTDYRLNGSHLAFDEFVNRIIQFLVSKQNAKRFNVRSLQFFTENDNIEFEAELYNETWELINIPEVILTLKDSTGNTTEYNFKQGLKSYRLNIGSLPAGYYEWTAKTKWQTTAYDESGVFVVKDLPLEFMKTCANHKLLSMIAVRSDGKLVFPQQLPELSEEILSLDFSKPRIIEQHEQSDLIHLKWIFFILLFWIALEWFLRKFLGTY